MLDFKFNAHLKDFDLAHDLKDFDLARDLKNEIKSYEELDGISILRLGWTSMPNFVSMVHPWYHPSSPQVLTSKPNNQFC